MMRKIISEMDKGKDGHTEGKAAARRNPEGRCAREAGGRDAIRTRGKHVQKVASGWVREEQWDVHWN